MDSHAWEQRQLGEVAQRVTRRNLNNECSRVLTASAEAGLIDQQEYFILIDAVDGGISVLDHEKYHEDNPVHN